jgi:hypothetical protein
MRYPAIDSAVCAHLDRTLICPRYFVIASPRAPTPQHLHLPSFKIVDIRRLGSAFRAALKAALKSCNSWGELVDSWQTTCPRHSWSRADIYGGLHARNDFISGCSRSAFIGRYGSICGHEERPPRGLPLKAAIAWARAMHRRAI